MNMDSIILANFSYLALAFQKGNLFISSKLSKNDPWPIFTIVDMDLLLPDRPNFATTRRLHSC